MTPNRLPEIRVQNRQRKIAANAVVLEEFARRVLPLCAQEQGNGLTNLDEIDVLLISDRKISELHRRFMQISGPTDVITFQHGEIFISVETAQRQAKAFQTTMDDEIRLYLVHGLLHLQGFDDNQPKARRRIEAAQRRILRRLLPHLRR